jgi:hypothetical protein
MTEIRPARAADALRLAGQPFGRARRAGDELRRRAEPAGAHG